MMEWENTVVMESLDIEIEKKYEGIFRFRHFFFLEKVVIFSPMFL